MSLCRIPESEIPEDWKDKHFLIKLRHQQGLNARTIAYELDIDQTKLSIWMERNNVIRGWQDKEWLAEKFANNTMISKETFMQSSPFETLEDDAFNHAVNKIMQLPEVNCSRRTIYKWSRRHGFVAEDPGMPDVVRCFEKLDMPVPDIADRYGMNEGDVEAMLAHNTSFD